jgi:hypothetical protein
MKLSTLLLILVVLNCTVAIIFSHNVAEATGRGWVLVAFQLFCTIFED